MTNSCQALHSIVFLRPYTLGFFTTMRHCPAGMGIDMRFHFEAARHFKVMNSNAATGGGGGGGGAGGAGRGAGGGEGGGGGQREPRIVNLAGGLRPCRLRATPWSGVAA